MPVGELGVQLPEICGFRGSPWFGTHLAIVSGCPRRATHSRSPQSPQKEAPVFPTPEGEVCDVRDEASSNLRLDCASGMGTAAFVTGAFGFAAAAVAVRQLLGEAP